MNNKKIIQKVLGHKSGPNLNNEGHVPSFTWLPESNDNTLRKAKASPSATTIWSNSIYSFNKNYLKNIPSVDNIVNKIIKSFFTINALSNNPNGLKSRLVQRRYKRLSLNRILVSKSEVKHTNDKVFINVYLFNKKKRSLLLKLKNLYNTLSFKKSFTGVTIPLGLASKNIELKANTLSIKDKKNTKSLKNAFINKYAFVELISQKVSSSNKDFASTKKASLVKKNHGQTNTNSFLNNVLYYKNLNNLTQHNIRTFIGSLQKSFGVSGRLAQPLNETINTNLNIVNKNLGVNLKSFFKDINKYKLYKGESYNVISKNNINDLGFSAIQVKKPNYSIYKLKSAYKLFTLYNNITLSNGLSSETYSRKLLLNTYKLLKKSYANLSLKNQTELNSSAGISNFSINGIVSLKDGGFVSRRNSSLVLARKRNMLSSMTFKNSKSYLNLRKTMKNIILMNKLNRIDRFFSKYKDILLQNNSSLSNSKVMGANNLENQVSSQIISTYKIEFINELLERELLYIYYLKLLSYNNALFKNWFLYSLKTLLSKIYNKKVVLNLINLKYIHLNSDIFSEAVNIRLRNFKKNRVVKVLKKAIKLVPISKVNIYACDEHSSTYKYVQNYYNKFRPLKLDIFKELGIGSLASSYTSEASLTKNTGGISPASKGPCTIKRLNHIQASTINFIKYKSVFGVRLEAAGRLTKRSTASRSIFKFRYNGTLKNSPIINNSISSVILKDNRISNLQFTQITSKTRNGSFGLKGWINNN